MDVRLNGTPASTPVDESAAAEQRAQIARLAHEFEAMFMAEMLRGMRSSMLEDEDGEGLGAATMTDTFDGELSRSLSESGGLGLASVLMEALDRRFGPAPAAGASTADAGAVAAPYAFQATRGAVPGTTSAAHVVAGSVPVRVPGSGGVAGRDEAAASEPGQVSSAFGWRADPFTGQAKFHSGTDFRMAYGQEVRAVAGGRVVAAEERPGYGLTVVIDHGQGLETRYAHLSGFAVRAGEQVEAGQVVARSGNSGRSTAPHLHVEARQFGRAVELQAALKRAGEVADLPGSQSLVRSSHED